MKKSLIIAVIIVLAGAAAWYFMKGKGGSNSAFANHIPSNSDVVVSFNIASMAQKADLKSLSDLDLVKDFMASDQGNEDDKALMKSLFDDPKSTGIDFKANPTLFVQGVDGSTSTGLLLKIADVANYEATMKKVMKDAKQNTIGSNTYLQEEGDKTVAMWNNTMAIIYTGSQRKTAALTADSILNGDIQSMKSNKVYNGLETNDDIFVLVQNNRMYGQELSGPMAGLDFPKDAYSAIHANFENGKISIENEAIYANDEDQERMNFQGDNLDKNLISYVAMNKPIMATQMSFNVEKLLTFFMSSKKISDGFSGMAEEVGVQRKELMNLLNGDIALAFTDFKMINKEIEFFGSKMTREVPEISAGVYLGINDKALFEKLIGKAGLKKEGGLYKFQSPFFSFSIAETEEGIVIGMNGNEMNKLAETKKLSDGQFENIKNYIDNKKGFAYVNINISTWPEEMQSMLKKQMGEEYKIFEAATAPFDHIHGESVANQKAQTTVYMRDASKNSLAQLVEMMNTLGKLVKERDAERQKAREEYERMMEEEDLMEEDVMMEEEAEMEMAE